MEVSRIKDLYYVLMKNKLGNHKICKTLIRHGEIRVNDQVITDVRYPVKADDIIMYHHIQSVSYTHLRAHETGRNLVCRLLLEKKKKKNKNKQE